MGEMLQVERWDVGGAAWLLMDGELDRVAVARHAPRIRALSRAPSIVLDLRRLSFIDLGGLRFLLRLIEDAAARDAGVRAILSAPVRHLAEAADATELLGIAAEPAGLLAAQARAQADLAAAPPPGLGGPPSGVAGAQAAALRKELGAAIARARALQRRSARLADLGRDVAGLAGGAVDQAYEARERRGDPGAPAAG